MVADSLDNALRRGPAAEVYIHIPSRHCLIDRNQGKCQNRKNDFSFAHVFFSLKMLYVIISDDI
jgi:hypothetical protein